MGEPAIREARKRSTRWLRASAADGVPESLPGGRSFDRAGAPPREGRVA